MNDTGISVTTCAVRWDVFSIFQNPISCLPKTVWLDMKWDSHTSMLYLSVDNQHHIWCIVCQAPLSQSITRSKWKNPMSLLNYATVVVLLNQICQHNSLTSSHLPRRSVLPNTGPRAVGSLSSLFLPTTPEMAQPGNSSHCSTVDSAPSRHLQQDRCIQ